MKGNKKTIFFILILINLIGVAVYLFLPISDSQSTDWENDFSVEEINEVSKIILRDKAENEMVLEKEEYGWSVNGKYQVRQHLLEHLMDALENMQADVPVSRAAFDNVVIELVKSAVQVDVFLNNEKEASHVFWVGGANHQKTGTYMLRLKDGEPASTPYEVIIPGFKGSLTSRFYVDENEWRSRIVYEHPLENIQSVEVQYHQEDSLESFTIEKVNGTYAMAVSGSVGDHRSVSENKIIEYLTYFETLAIEAYENQYDAKDSIIEHYPYATISVVDVNNTINSIDIYYMPVYERSKSVEDDLGNPLLYDVDRYFAHINNRQDWAIIQQYVFGKVFKKSSDFLETNE